MVKGMKQFFASLFLGVVLLVIGTHLSSDAAAAAFDTEYTKPLPSPKTLSYDSFITETELVANKPFRDSSLEYSMRIPNGWRQSGMLQTSGASESAFSYGTVSEYLGPASFGLSSILEVQVYELKNAVSAFHWLYNHLFTNGYSVEAINPQSWEVAEAMYISFQRGGSYKVRLKAILFGENVIVASYLMPIGNEETERDLQAHTVNSFSVSGEQKPNEPLKEYELFNIAKFDFFRDWVFNTEDLSDVQNITVSFSHLSDQKASVYDDFINIDGFLSLSLLERVINPDLGAEVKKIADQMEEEGYLLGELIENVTSFQPKPGVAILGAEAYELIDQTGKRIDHELWVGILQDSDYYYFIVLDSPSRDGNFIEWAHNIAAFKLAIETVTPVN